MQFWKVNVVYERDILKIGCKITKLYKKSVYKNFISSITLTSSNTEYRNSNDWIEIKFKSIQLIYLFKRLGTVKKLIYI